MTLEERIQAAESRIFKVVFPNTTNHYDTLFGGMAMYLMDEVAFITATRFARKKVVTVSSGKIDFKQPIPADTIIELVGKVMRIGNTSLDVEVEIFDQNGRLILSSPEKIINVSQLLSGVYFVKCLGINKKLYCSKFVKI